MLYAYGRRVIIWSDRLVVELAPTCCRGSADGGSEDDVIK